ncbi:MAG: hypothetical protein EA412_03455 [Chitinophagaceae bacterium]|nr:MAG: hypothetical protein EA412_03455 [Chitinophagaceae bacterium]
MEKTENIEKVILQSVRRDRNQQVLYGFLFLFLSGMLFFRWSENLPQEMPQTNIFLKVIAILLFGFTTYLFYNASRLINAANHKVAYLLKNDPEKIVWVYTYRVVPMPFGIKFTNMVTVFFRFLDGDGDEVRVKDSEHDKLLEELKNKLPHACFGFNNEKEQLFRVNPAMLIKDIDDDKNRRKS